MASHTQKATAGPFLELLYEEAPLASFELPLREAQAAGASAEDLERLRSQMVMALQVRATLAERRRRESELAALNETAADLTAIRDVGRVLQAIVRRARALLGTDTSYVTLIDEEQGDTYMRVTEGIVNAEFQNLRLAFGAGLGGLVAQSRNPYATPNYPQDERFAHTRTIDDAVIGEGLIAILGVPILHGERVIGVLFAADRRERTFTPEEVALLSAFAAHAAVAIENARLFQEAEQALTELNQANAVISAHSLAVERAAAAHERLAGIVLQGGGVAEVADAIAELFRGGLLVLDPAGRVIGRGGAAQDDWLDEVVGEHAEAALGHGRTVDVDRDPPCWIAPVLAGSEHLGSLVLWPHAAPADVDLRTLERAAQVTALLLLNQRSVIEAEQRIRSELLDDILRTSDPDGAGLSQRALRLGVDLAQPHCLVVTRAGETARHRTAAAAATFARDRGGLAGLHGDEVVLLMPATDPAEAAAQVSGRLSAMLGEPVTSGGAGPVTAVEALREAHEEAARCVRVLEALGRPGEAATVADLGAYSLLLAQLGREDLSRFIVRTVGPVLDYDAARGTELLATLEAYFANAGNLSRTSAALHIHVNTLYQRMERIGRLVGDGWQGPDRALELHLAVKLHHLRSTT